MLTYNPIIKLLFVGYEIQQLSCQYIFKYQSLFCNKVSPIYYSEHKIQLIVNLIQHITKMDKGPTNYSNHCLENYQACMVLAAVGDAMGYKNGDWQFLTSSKIIHQQMMEMTQNKGPLALQITMGWRYSDDTVMHIATALGILSAEKTQSISHICIQIAKQYKKCWGRMSGRAPGKTTGKSIKILEEDGSNWNKIPYNQRAYGCGASMRSACIGLAFYDDIQKLVALSIQSGRMTHHNPVGYLGSVISALFTGLAIRKVDPNIWIAYFLDEALPECQRYVRNAGRQVQANLQRKSWKDFVQAIKDYAKKRDIAISLKDEPKNPDFPKNYGIIQRQHFYKSLAWNGWPGALGIDSVLISYDAFLSSNGSWEQLCLRGILHGGDNDSTGTIAGAWFGAYYGYKGVPKNHFKQLEDGNKLKNFGESLYHYK